MKTYRTLSNQFEMTIERKPIKKYLNILSIPGNAKASTYILKNQKKKIILKNLYLADSLGSYVKHFFFTWTTDIENDIRIGCLNDACIQKCLQTWGFLLQVPFY